MKLRKIALVAAFAAAATSASAVTVDDSVVAQMTSSANMWASADGTQLHLSYSGAPIAAYWNFTAAQTSNVFLSDYSSNAEPTDVSGVTLALLNSVNGSEIVRLSTDTAFCAAAPGPIAGDCNLISDVNATAGPAAGAAKASTTTPLFSAIGAGSYRLGFFDNATPTQASMTFTILPSDISPVPLPAAGLLVLTGFGALGALRARRRRG